MFREVLAEEDNRVRCRLGTSLSVSELVLAPDALRLPDFAAMGPPLLFFEHISNPD